MKSLVDLRRNQTERDKAMVRRRAIAASTIDILDGREYECNDGSQIDLVDDIAASCAGTAVFQLERIPDNTMLKDHSQPVYFYQGTTLQCCHDAIATQGPIAVLNFASAVNPGGGFERGFEAQEESLARSSTLISSLTSKRAMAKFYKVGRKDQRFGYHHDLLIFSPNVMVFRDEFTGTLYSEPYPINVFSCAAVDADEVRESVKKSLLDKDQSQEVMFERIKNLLHAMARFNKFNSVVLGAFGCGIFGNDVDLVAAAFADTLSKVPLKNVYFAIPDDATFEKFRSAFLKTKSEREGQPSTTSKSYDTCSSAKN